MIGRLSEEIGRLVDTFAKEVELVRTIPGVEHGIGEMLLGEIGADMSRFPSGAHLASWADMCPGNHELAGQHKSGKPRNGSKWLRAPW